MTETNNKPQRGRGRPRKYFIDEERKQEYKRYVKECMERNPFYCVFCDHTYHMASKSKHLKSKIHLKFLQKMWVNFNS